MRYVLLALSLAVFPLAAGAVDAPSAQLRIEPDEVVRGSFVEERQMKGLDDPMRSSGHFIVAPAHGLIWKIEEPFMTSTIITPHGLTQDIGGVALKLPAKNFHHLYDMIGRALAGDWNGLENDFSISRSSHDDHWQMVLTPHPHGTHSLSYVSITVSGQRFVENIAMMKADGSYDTLAFADEAMSSTPLPAKEMAFFNEAEN